MKLQVSRSVRLPDPVKLARFRRTPELGPRVLFFSGGTALRPLSQALLDYTHNSIHLITPFDSGGSSAVLRNAFSMPAVGDLRNRLMALADRTVRGNPAIFELFAHRLPKDAGQADLREQLDALVRGKTKLVRDIPDPMRKIIRNHLRFFVERMPDDFDLRGASVGNLILTGGYFNNGRHIDPVIYLFGKLVEVRGHVRPVVNEDLHLRADLEDGTVVVGQHLITGKETAPLVSPVRRLSLCKGPDDPEPVTPQVQSKIREAIGSAELICYPMGSFYSSVLCNLLPGGVAGAVSDTDCPKVYVPNTGHDPEQTGMTLLSSVRVLLDTLQAGCPPDTPRDRLLNFVLLDSGRGGYPEPLELERIRRMGVEILDAPLVTDDSAPLLDETAVIEHLLSLA